MMMEWSDRMNSAINYIECNIDDELDIISVSEKANSSSFHFQKMFYAILGLTPTEYIRRRRLTLAASDLILGNEKVIDIAMRYGYDSPNAFTRAFRKMHGINPSEVRTSGVKAILKKTLKQSYELLLEIAILENSDKAV